MRKSEIRKIWKICLLLLVLNVVLNGQNFIFTSGNPKYDKPFADAKANIAFNTKTSGSTTVFHAGAYWDQVWTRDGSYSIEMACGLIDPVTSRGTFNYTTTTWNGLTVQLQDVCGHFGGWPNLTDGIVWATGAWAFYRQTGDASFLSYAYPIIRNSLLRAETEVRDPADGLFKGCASFMESNSGYPASFANNGTKVGATKAGSTNMLHYNAYVVAAKMAKLLNKPQSTIDSLNQKAAALKNAINSNLWNPSKGYYYYFKYPNGTYQEQNEGLADAFAILFDIADSAKKVSILEKTIPSPWGHVCQYPQYPEWSDYSKGDADYYHSYMVWPFVQGYIAWAAAKMKNTQVFMFNMDKLAQLWAKSSPGEFREFYRPLDGTPDGGGQQLWSASGYITMVFHGLFGMNFEVDGIRFDPIVPDTFKNPITLNNFVYRKMTLNMTLKGPGKYLKEFVFDGVSQWPPFVSGSLTGTHSIVMTVSNTPVEVKRMSNKIINKEPVKIKIDATSDKWILKINNFNNFQFSLYSFSGKLIMQQISKNGIVIIPKHIVSPQSYMICFTYNKKNYSKKILLK
jgi:hypothetical protein